MKSKFYILTTPLLIFAVGCKKFVQVDPPPTNLSSTSVYNNSSTASAAVTGIYEQMMENENSISGAQSVTSLLGLSADELQAYPNSPLVLQQAYSNTLKNNSGLTFWNQFYNYIYLANTAIVGLNGSSGVTDSLKNQFLGEALFIRAFMHFYLVNIYGAVPWVTSTNYQTNEVIGRTAVQQIYKNIIADLKNAQGLLSSGFVDGNGNTTMERTRPNSGAATALLARTYLYTKQWDSAALEASLLINNGGTYGLDTLNGVFLANSIEAIWQLDPVQPGYNTYDGSTFILASGPNTGFNPLYLNTPLLSSFEPNDQRFSDWIGSYVSTVGTYYYPYKYKVPGGAVGTPVTEYLMVLRLGEQYLIRAEAEAEGAGGGPAASINDLNVIRNRAGLPNYSGGADQASVLAAILHERQVELFAEWGHRWLDLNRTNSTDSVLGPPGNICQAKGGQWSADWELYPLLLTELQADPSLQQNPGY
jgi:hypothetical protein